MIYVVASFALFYAVFFIALGLYIVGSILLGCGIVLYIVDIAVTPEYKRRYVPSVIPSTTDKLVEYDTECTQPKLPV